MPLNRLGLLLALFLAAAHMQAAERRALLIGINDYTASRFAHHPKLDRDWPSLGGAVRDAGILRQMLIALYGFEERDVVTLTDQAATRDAILRAVEEQLVRPASKDDIVFFYFAGHGSQVANSLSDEPDKLDESIVPADSRAGAADIRDKELRALFNRVLDRGARLTVMLDNCHSGSGTRGLAAGARPRGMRPDLRDVRDGTYAGPRPEERGALVLAATQDYDVALETRDADGLHGVFSLAWIKAMRDAVPDEPASETFLRAQARMRAGTPFQEPVMSGDAAARARPFLGARIDGHGGRNVVAVERTLGDGTVLLQGGWANGLAVGTELRASDGVHLTVTVMHGLGRSEARLDAGQWIEDGALLDVVGWAAPPGRPLRIWAPRSVGNVAAAARRLFAAAKQRGIRWVDDPCESTPTHLLRYGLRGWELIEPDGDARRVGVEEALERVPAGASLFMQLPASMSLIDAIDAESAASTEEADYILVGRYVKRRLEYAWVRPAMSSRDQRRSGLPVRSDWTRNGRETAVVLREAFLRLRRIHAWLHLESPPGSRSPYRLAVRGTRGGQLVQNGVVIGGQSYRLVLRAPVTAKDIQPRFFYVFIVDRHGKSYLAFPRGAVENRFPMPGSSGEIPLDRFRVMPPFGADTYFLLSTDEPLPNPWILEWDGVRTRSPKSPTPLERLLMLTDADERGRRLVTPIGWSLERVIFESVPPPMKRRAKKRH
ncbi:MAG TPA: caspase family protein [Thermoanaerobaculia bacterium]|nr:caspase family protein [Thermoanaerobaculia bacterium]